MLSVTYCAFLKKAYPVLPPDDLPLWVEKEKLPYFATLETVRQVYSSDRLRVGVNQGCWESQRSWVEQHREYPDLESLIADYPECCYFEVTDCIPYDGVIFVPLILSPRENGCIMTPSETWWFLTRRPVVWIDPWR